MKVATALSVSVTVAEAVPLTGADEAAMPVMVEVPSPLSVIVNDGSLIEKVTPLTVPPEGVVPSAKKGTMDAMDDWPILRTRVFIVEAPENLIAIPKVIWGWQRRRSISSTSR